MVFKLMSVACLLVYAAIAGSVDEEVVIVDSSWHGTAEPSRSLEDPNVVSERNSRVFDLDELCRSGGNLPAWPSNSCMEELNEYFSTVPIWRGVTVFLFEGTRASGHYSAFDARTAVVWYDESDYTREDLPTWSDIFDGNEEDRLNIVASVFGDSACLALKELGRIRSSYETRCAARELFKYARYLEACMTGFARSSFFNSTVSEGGATQYERVRGMMNPAEIVYYKNGNGWHLVENFLLSIWVTQQCLDLHFVTVGEYAIKPATGELQGTVNEMAPQLGPMYHASMAIAARAGDPWAIQAYHEKSMSGDVHYWQSVYELNPLLFHRWMSFGIGHIWFDKDMQLLHARAAYELAKEIVPEMKSVTFQEYVRGRGGGFADPEFTYVERVVDRSHWKSELEYPWDRVPNAFKEIQRNLRRYEATDR